jgi:hypothetical protein
MYSAMVTQSVQRLLYGLDDWGSISGRSNDGIFFSLLHRVQTGSGTHPAFYPIGIEGYYRGD